MRILFLAAVAVGALGVAAMVPYAAQARDYPFCIKGGDYDNGLGDCSFDTYEQCRATASGRDSWCDANPYYVSQEPRVSYPRMPHIRR
jgi:hypothetical protein